ncbi:Predicted thiol-disulfide oxidoreductase YuxK, DCC family [Paenibacillus sp. UNCCL117]|uniref:thiol-disulfide oxidoreductase DCC family protein n=1 Tax=unclassified Paenibacillus TaxID=185978 RepID=UPI00087E5098|nr:MULTISPECIES: thiol-disulfide oxidoreductase DCC family protein [unclassified Paenibacillus]SDD61675.1 Predicted thiol-disulfide oxidoreductase YuxK, DCC family [Paenibacillus sp. cl123]SFW67543.1 Predicted thiol-disulfide oxidoreductase YuxK, DCC family [Paenibacillus sp. UNCCL117]
MSEQRESGRIISVHPVVLYDGDCGFCQRAVQFILPRDRRGIFRFAALQSETGQSLLRQHGLEGATPDTFVLVQQGRAFTRSTAGLRVLRELGGAWRLCYAAIIVPAPLRDAVYSLFARHRYRLFGRTDACMIPSPEVRERFLDRG